MATTHLTGVAAGTLASNRRIDNGASYSTDLTTIEECDRTMTIVHEGRVEVFDTTRGVRARVSAGERYEAQTPGAAGASPPLRRNQP